MPQQRTGSYRVVLERPEGEFFGVTMGGHPSIQGLLVVDLLETTAVRRWNDRNRQCPVEIGLAVLEVNGISEPRAAMFQAMRDSRTVQLLLSSDISPQQLEVLRSSVEFHRRRTVVENMLEDVHGEEPGTCSICFDEGSDEKEARLPCGHRFHRSCVERWLLFRYVRCPICNSEETTRSPSS
eukprot:Skav211713  [mRNA]  locus=scaffold2852:330095:330640:- [translate_table: standard]